MNEFVSEWAESRYPLYSADGIESLYSSSNRPVHTLEEGTAALIVIASGKGTLKLGDGKYELAEGSVILLPAQSRGNLIGNALMPLHAYKLSIRTREQEDPLLVPSGGVTRRSELAGSPSLQFYLYEPIITAQVEELYIHRLPESEARHLQNQILFHQILLRLLELQEAKYAASEHPSMERSIAYVEDHFSEKITRGQLAAIAGISQSHYSSLFKQLTGFSPNEYLSRLRVHRAKELLLSGAGTLREIAQKVGYKDEFYLSRRFKQQTGLSPSGFSPGKLQRVAVWSIPYASHLLLLGLEPAVILSESSEYVSAEEVQAPQNMLFLTTSCSVEQVTSVLLGEGIELIIAANQQLRQYGLTPGHLRAVAPILDISWMELGWKEHLRLIARAVHRSGRAERWLAEFQQEERAARSRIRQSAVAEETIAILVMKPEELLVYGGRNAGYVIYHSLELRPPARIGEAMKKHGERFHSVSIALSELADYAGSRLLVIPYPDARGSTAHTEAIWKSPYWNQLDAVQEGRVHVLDRDEWIPYNPVSIRAQLSRAVALFASIQ